MTVAQAIDKLQEIVRLHGANVQVYFDCPTCKQSFTPGFVAVVAIMITGEEKR